MITVGIASIFGREKGLLRTVESITNQVDKIFIALNNYTEVPQELKSFSNVECVLLDNTLSDSAKFYHVEECEGYYFALDDDLVVPPTYCSYLLHGVDKYNGLVSLHGRRYPVPFRGFKKWVGNYRCLNSVGEDQVTNFVGSGCCAFNTQRLRLKISDFSTPNMADCYLSRMAYGQGVPMVVLAHPAGYLQYTCPAGATIWEQTKDYTIHNRILASYIK